MEIQWYLDRYPLRRLRQGYRLPRSTATIWRILDQNQPIIRPAKIEHTLLTRAGPLEVMQMDFKDVSGV